MAQGERATVVGDGQLAKLRTDVERWRRTRTKLSPMPAPLWREAVRLARSVGVSVVAQELGLNATRLRAQLTAPSEESRASAPAHFVELGRMPVAQTTAGPVVELTDAAGATLVVRLAAGATLDVAHLVEAFRRGTP